MFSRLVPAPFTSTLLLSPAAVLGQTAPTESGQTYPTKPMRLIVPFAPGGTSDPWAQARLSTIIVSPRTLGQVRRNPARQDVGSSARRSRVKARPDGYTLLMVSSAYTDESSGAQAALAAPSANPR